MKFDELEPSAQRVVLAREAEHVGWGHWWDSVYEDAKRVGELLGVTIDEIRFSGFWSQGDGASFTGEYRYRPDALIEIKAYAPQDSELHAIAQELTTQQVACSLTYGVSYECALVRIPSRHVHSDTMETRDWGLSEFSDEHTAVAALDRAMQALMRRLADWIYRQLQIEYEYLTSEECVRAQSLDYDEDGDIVELPTH